MAKKVMGRLGDMAGRPDLGRAESKETRLALSTLPFFFEYRSQTITTYYNPFRFFFAFRRGHSNSWIPELGEEGMLTVEAQCLLFASCTSKRTDANKFF